MLYFTDKHKYVTFIETGGEKVLNVDFVLKHVIRIQSAKP